MASRSLIVLLVSLGVAAEASAQAVTSVQDGPWSSSSTWNTGAPPTASDTVRILHRLVDPRDTCAALYVAAEGALTSESASELEVAGEIVNDGVVEAGTANLRVSLGGDLTTTGVWKPDVTTYAATGMQQVRLGNQAVLEGTHTQSEPSGTLLAASPLVFGGPTQICHLNANALGLEFRSEITASLSCFLSAQITNAADIAFTAESKLSRLKVAGDYTLHGMLNVGIATVLEGTVTVSDTLQNHADGSETIRVEGHLTNRGVVRDNPEARTLTVHVTGDIVNEGQWSTRSTGLSGTGPRTILGSGIDGEIRAVGAHVVLRGQSTVPRLVVDSGSLVTVALESALRVTDAPTFSCLRIRNYGLVSVTTAVGSAISASFCEANVSLVSGHGLDSLTVETYGNQVPVDFANAIRTWWRFESTPPGGLLSDVAFSYEDSLLGANLILEDSLQLYHDLDGGWRQISIENLPRSSSSNFVSFENVAAQGSFTLAAPGVLSVSARPSIITRIAGLTEIRIGVPTVYEFSYYNNSDLPTGGVLLAVTTLGGINILNVRPGLEEGGMADPIDIGSLILDEDSTRVLLWADGMAPRETRSFLYTVSALPDGSGKMAGTLDGEAVTLLGGVAIIAGWIAAGVGSAYISDVLTKTCQEIWRPADCDESKEIIRKSLDDAIRETNEEWAGTEKPLSVIMGNLRDKMIENALGIGLGPLGLLNALYEWFVAYVAGAMDYNRELQRDEGEQCESNPKLAEAPCICLHNPIEVSTSQLPLEKVTSLDPNSKAGPAGVEGSPFIAASERMYYRVNFENKAEAAAAAYKIVIVDTLNAEFNPLTVLNGQASHDGFSFSVDGDILRWEVEGIDLPPNVNPPEGEGWVSFSVEPEIDLSSGTELRNSATITFDLNEPITTNVVSNVLDFLPPVTTMQPMPVDSDASQVLVRWVSTDGALGSGVAASVLYASRDGARFEPVITTAADSVVLRLDTDHQYEFYALAKDRAGNVESSRPALVSTFVTTAVSSETEVPVGFELLQNYPNPFNPTTTLSYAVPRLEPARLEVFDILGRRVVILTDGIFRPGKHSITWDASHMASGVYVVVLRQGDRTAYRKVLLLR